MNLQPRFHLLTIVFFVVFAIPSWMAVRALAEGIMEQWAVRYAEKQVLYDKGRTLQPILREVRYRANWHRPSRSASGHVNPTTPS